jgi:hypothetical protein
MKHELIAAVFGYVATGYYTLLGSAAAGAPVILEHALLAVRAGLERDFEGAFTEAALGGSGLCRLGLLCCFVCSISEVEQPAQHTTVLLRERCLRILIVTD